MKKVLMLILIIVQYTTVVISKEVYIIPVYQERLTGKWCGLFAHDAGGLWSMFKQKMVNETDPLASALQGLKEQTNGVYSYARNEKHKPHSLLTLNDGNVICCVPIQHMTIPMLQQKMVKSVDQDIRKDKFIWVPMEDLLARTTIVRSARNMTTRCKFDDFTKSIIKNYWESLLQPQLNASVNKEKALTVAAKRAPRKASIRVTQAKEIAKPVSPKKPVGFKKNMQIAKVQAKPAQSSAPGKLHNRIKLLKMQKQRIGKHV